MPLSAEEYQRYERQMILHGFGKEAQLKLQQAKVLVVGAGGLGCTVLLYLTAAGVGTIGIADDDVVSISNLHRQVLYSVDDIGKLKTLIAKEKLQRQNPNVRIEIYTEKITSSNALKIISDYDIVVDGTDNFPAKYLLNDACVLGNKILVYSSILRFEGQVSVFNHQTKINYRDLFPQPPQNIPNCTEAGVPGPLCGVMGSIQANEVIKIITGMAETLDGKLLRYNSIDNNTQIFQIRKENSNPPIELLIDYELFCSSQTEMLKEINAEELKKMLNEKKDIQLIDVREPWEKEQDDPWKGISIPMADIEKNTDQISKNKTVVLYCKTGARSRQAILRLQKLGFINLINLAG